jgi:hypothetical protein
LGPPKQDNEGHCWKVRYILLSQNRVQCLSEVFLAVKHRHADAYARLIAAQLLTVLR